MRELNMHIPMWKKQLIVLLCILLMLPGNFSFASKYSEYEGVELRDGSSQVYQEYQPVNLMIRGVDIFSDAPGIIVNGRALVPIAAILTELGVQYAWNGATREITFTSNGKKVVMQIDNKYATINGARTLLPDGVAPRVMTYKSVTGEFVSRTYVPIKFISDVLDLSASWIAETRTVAINKKAQTLTNASVKYKDYDKNEIGFSVTGEVDFTSYVVDGANVGGQDKIVIDFQNTVLQIPSGAKVSGGIWTLPIGDGIFGLDKIEISQTSTNPHNTRVTIYQNERRGNRVYYNPTTKEMVVQFINSVNEVSVQEIYSTDTVVIGTRENPFYNVDIVGKTLIVDIINSYLKINNGVFQALPVNKGKIDTISYQQLNTKNSEMYSPEMEVTRVSIALKEAITYDEFFIEDKGGNLFVYIADNPINNFGYVKQNSETAKLTVDLFGAASVSPVLDAATRKVTFEVPKDKTDLGSFEQEIKDHIVDKFVVSESATSYRVEVTMSENTSFTSSVSSKAVTLNFTNRVIRDSEFKGTLIVIDAGHGGKDPGAVGSKAYEKDITLKSAKMLESELLKQGFKVYMTRTTDEYVGLYERAAMANALDATLFVSIHANAFTNPNVNGVEVLYGNDSLSSDRGLAQKIQNQLVSALGATNRGVASRPRLVVVRETKMTSVLVELGFITNPVEQDKLMSDAYLLKAAAAMAKGIVDFLK